jgi:allantoin racemase
MKLLLVNPNTTASMTAKMAAAARAVLAPGTTLTAVTAAHGPASIEGYYDEVFCVPATLEAIAGHDDAAGIVIGCFDDTGVDAARCMVDVPVVGICQAAMQAATVLAGSFSVVTTLSRSVPALTHLAHRYGHERHCRRVWAAEVPVLDLEEPGGDAGARIRECVRTALAEDASEAIVLGCGGMADLAGELSVEFGVPVVEGVTTAVKLVEGLARIGLRTSSRGGYARPARKTYSGPFAPQSPR